MISSSPKYPQSNGLIEWNVQTIKNLLKKAKEGMKDEQLALLEFRNTPISGLQESPCNTCTVIDESKAAVNSVNDTSNVTATCQCEYQGELKHRQTTQKIYYDKITKNLPILKPNDTVQCQSKQSWEAAVVGVQVMTTTVTIKTARLLMIFQSTYRIVRNFLGTKFSRKASK